MAGLSRKNLTRRERPRLPFARAAKWVLPTWDISLVFVGESRARALNRTLRGKEYVPNVLSYQAGTRSGEVIICLSTLAREAPRYELSPSAYCLLLFIHGLLHLKGLPHGVTMERRERALMARLSLASRARRTTPSITHGQTNSYRHRHRHVPGKAGRRRRSR